MSDNSLNAVSPIDGRYHLKTKTLEKYFSEAALIRYRVKVEIEYFIALCELPLPELKNLKKSDYEKLRSYYQNFNNEDEIKRKDFNTLSPMDALSFLADLKSQYFK